MGIVRIRGTGFKPRPRTDTSPRTYTHVSGHTITPCIVGDTIVITVRGKRPFKRFIRDGVATLARAHDIARNMALNPLKPPSSRVDARAAFQPQIWGFEMAARLSK
jgi:hypothetical protein